MQSFYRHGGMGILRVISGIARGHKLKTLKGNNTRPTTDRVKESLFNIIAPYLAQADVLDMFAGTGSLGIEALSRGAKSAVFIDKNRECAVIIKDNLAHTKLIEKAELLTGDALDILRKLKCECRKFDIVFLDPPYNRDLLQQVLSNISDGVILKDDAVIAAERSLSDILPETTGCLKLIRNQKYGDTILSFFSKESVV